MGGLVQTVGKAFDSDIGRVITGVATGGMSEVGRAVGGVARRSGVDPTVAAGLGAYAGGSLGSVAPKPLGGGGVQVPDAVRGPDTLAAATSASATLLGDAKAQEKQAADDTASKIADDNAARTKAEEDLAARTETPQEAEDAKRRAGLTALRFTGGKRRASSQLTSTLGGTY